MQISGHALHGENLIRTTHLFLSHNQQLHHNHVVTGRGFGQVMENLESHGILYFHFPGLESPEIKVWVMESHCKAY